MSLRSLRQLLGNLENQPPAVQQFQQLLTAWAEVTGPGVAAHTRPLSIDRGVLYVATASSAWAQDLVFKRRQLLQKLNSRLSESLAVPLSDIRFSPAQWQDKPTDRPALGSTQQAQVWAEHPSRHKFEPEALGLEASGNGDPESSEHPVSETLLSETSLAETLQQDPETPAQSFQQWATRVRSRSQTFPLCPECHCPTPLGELQRWQVCGVCAAKQWQK